MFKVDNQLSVLIGKSLSRTSSITILDPTSASYIASGEIIVLDKTDTPLTPGATIAQSPVIRLVQGDGTTNPLIFTPFLSGRNILAYKGLSYAAPQEQISYVGYNTSSGNIQALNGNLYKLRLVFKWDKEMWSEQQNVRYYEYTSTSSDTSANITEKFIGKLLIDSFGNKEVNPEMVTDGTFTVLGGASTLTVVNGSTLATASAAGHNLVAGDYVRIGGAGAQFGVYRVASVSGTAITLAWAFQGTSAVVANANVGEMSSVTSYGIKLTGKAQTGATIPYNGLFRYQKVSFDTQISSFGTTAVTDSQTVNRGSGVDMEVAELEWMSLHSDGIRNRSHHPIPTGRSNTASGSKYDCIYIEFFDENTGSNVVSGNKPQKGQLYLFIVDGASQSTDILSQLNPWMASTPSAFANVSI